MEAFLEGLHPDRQSECTKTGRAPQPTVPQPWHRRIPILAVMAPSRANWPAELGVRAVSRRLHQEFER